MYDSDVKLSVLPDVLQELVIEYAFNLPKHKVLDSLNIILSINEMCLPFFFFRPKIWSWEYSKFLPNPVIEFMPIEYYNGLYSELFDDDALYCLLIGLDFRRKNVRLFGTRQSWLNRILSSWRAIEPFAAYYKMLMRSKTPIMKQRSSFISRFL